MSRLSIGVALTWLLAGGIAAAQDTPAPDAATGNSIRLVRVIADIPSGTPWLSLKTGLLCVAHPIEQSWTKGRVALNLSAYLDPFRKALEGAGYKVVTPGQDNLFEESANTADYEAAAIVTDEHIDGCTGATNIWRPVDAVRGESTMKVQWQLYSPIKKQVIARATTSGTAKLEERVEGGVEQLVALSFAENARALAQNADFRAAMSAPKAVMASFQTPDQQSKITLAGSLKAGPRKIADATGNVVTLLVGTGSGSGFLVSSDGYVLTDAHVVGDSKNVRVRWPDGLEAPGTVERVSKHRDVALIKTDPRGRTPLAINRGAVTPGERVYAIGSPKGQNFEGTVTSGIISADRTRDGLRYIQSDTMVSHGSSGGPLLDEKGEVIGLTDLGLPNEGPAGTQEAAGLNLFTPIGDAMDFLALEQK